MQIILAILSINVICLFFLIGNELIYNIKYNSKNYETEKNKQEKSS